MTIHMSNEIFIASMLILAVIFLFPVVTNILSKSNVKDKQSLTRLGLTFVLSIAAFLVFPKLTNTQNEEVKNIVEYFKEFSIMLLAVTFTDAKDIDLGF